MRNRIGDFELAARNFQEFILKSPIEDFILRNMRHSSVFGDCFVFKMSTHRTIDYSYCDNCDCTHGCNEWQLPMCDEMQLQVVDGGNDAPFMAILDNRLHNTVFSDFLESLKRLSVTTCPVIDGLGVYHLIVSVPNEWDNDKVLTTLMYLYGAADEIK